MDHKLPSVCPVCSQKLYVSKLTCPNCSSEISGKFSPCNYCALDDKMKLFLEAFLKSRGNIKEVERTLSISYPTVKGLLDELLVQLFNEKAQVANVRYSSDEIFDMLENKAISVDDAAALLAGKEISSSSIKLGSDNNE
jgi:hypothetical protein